MEFIYDFTEDGLKLQATHWLSDSKKLCVVCIHGQGGNIIENYFATVWGDILSKNDIGFIYGHNRGYSHINDISMKNGEFKRVGATFEIFEECEYDVELWVNKAKELGYQKIIMLGHSLGCNKIIYYLSKKGNVVNGVILASPPDKVGIKLLKESRYDDLVKEAKTNVDHGEPRKLLKDCYTSSENFINFYTEGNKIDNLPIERNPEHFEQLSKINVPILAFSGSNEYPTYLKLDIVKSKALNCPDFETQIVEGSGHIYKNCEEKTAKLMLDWIGKKINISFRN